METLKIAYIDFWPEWADEDFITPLLKAHFNIEIDPKNPDVIFHSVFGTNANNYSCKKILFLGENKRYQNYNTDYSITFDPHTNTNYRLPLWQAFILKKPELLDRLFNRVQHKSFDNFCSFTVSNGANFIRNGIFNQLNNYKKVKSYGRYMTNDQSLQKASQERYWRDAKDDFFVTNKHKFMLAYENNAYKYYCTEKLMDAFLGGSLPIYWGDVRAKEDWNDKAFIDGTKLGSGVLDIVKRLDNDQSLFDDMYSQPVFTDEQKKKLLENLKSFPKWLIKIINNDKK